MDVVDDVDVDDDDVDHVDDDDVDDVDHVDDNDDNVDDDVPSEGPKTKMVKKWSGNGFGPCQMTCPKSGQKVFKKWSKNGPSQIWVQKS